MGSLATIRGLHKAYVMGDETVHALDGVDLNFDRGEYIAILGPSGSGKSTLMHILGFMDTPTKGSILFEGEEVSNLSPDRRAWYRSNRVGFVFQSFNLLPRLSVLENVALPLLYREDYTEDAREEAAKIALERVGMSHRLTHRPTQLSGGERQRVAIARAIVAQSRQVWLVADHSKFERPAMIEMAPLKVVHTLFTDIAPQAAQQRLMEELGGMGQETH